MKNCNTKHNTIDQSNFRNVQLKNSPESRRKIGQKDDKNQKIKFSWTKIFLLYYFHFPYTTQDKSKVV